MSKNKYRCSVDGVIVVYGYKYHPKGVSGVCAKSSVSTSEGTFCLAHGNKKCQHKIKLEKGE